jgi:hypothetical protein
VLGTLQATDGNGTAAKARRQAAPAPEDDAFATPTLQDPTEALAEARREAAGASAEAEGAATAGIRPGAMPTRSAPRPDGLGPVDPEPPH